VADALAGLVERNPADSIRNGWLVTTDGRPVCSRRVANDERALPTAMAEVDRWPVGVLGCRRQQQPRRAGTPCQPMIPAAR
jgi:hypothetical protein